MPEILLPTIEGPHVDDSTPVAVIVKTVGPVAPRAVLRATDSTPLVTLMATVAPVSLAALVTEALHLTETMMTMDSEPRLEGVHVTDAPPLVSLTGAVVTPPLARLIPRERLRVVDRPIRIRRVRQGPPP